MDYIPIDKTEIPYKFEIDLAGEIYGFTVHYNARFDYFTVDLEKGGELVLVGSKVVYGNPLFSHSNDPRLPKVTILPYDLSGIETRTGYNQLGETVFLLIVEDDAA